MVNLTPFSGLFAVDSGSIVPHCSQALKKTEEIKVRVEPIKKYALEQIAAAEDLQLSDIVRRALGEFLDKQRTASQSPVAYAHP